MIGGQDERVREGEDPRRGERGEMKGEKKGRELGEGGREAGCTWCTTRASTTNGSTS